MISWPLQSFTAHIGSIREIAGSLEARLNDRLLLRFNKTIRTGTATLISASDDPTRALTAMTGRASGEFREYLAQLVRSPKELVVQRLIDRGDTWLAEALESS